MSVSVSEVEAEGGTRPLVISIIPSLPCPHLIVVVMDDSGCIGGFLPAVAQPLLLLIKWRQQP